MEALLVGIVVWRMGAVDPSPADEPPIPSDYTLQWRAPVGCPDAEEIRHRVARYHGTQSPGGGVARIDGEVLGDPHGGYALQLTTEFDAQTHTRRMHAPSCDELAEGTAIVIAVALREGLAVAMQPSDGPAPTVEPPIVPTPQRAEPSRVPAGPRVARGAPPRVPQDAAPIEPAPIDPMPIVAARRARPRPHALLHIAGLAEAGALGAVTGGVQLGVSAAWPTARVSISGTWLAARRRRDGPTGLSATFEGGTVAARGCWTPTIRALVLPLCGGIEAGTVRVDASFARPTTQHTPWAGPLASAAVVWRLGAVRPWIGLEGTVRAVGTRFRVRGRDGLGQWPASARALVGLEVPLGRGRKSTAGAKRSATPDTAGGSGAP